MVVRISVQTRKVVENAGRSRSVWRKVAQAMYSNKQWRDRLERIASGTPLRQVRIVSPLVS